MTQYHRLAEELKQQIKSGALKPGARLPSFATLRQQYGVNQNTIEKAHDLLEKEGIIERQRRRGTFVCEPPSRPLTGLIGFAGTAFALREVSPYNSHLVEGVQAAARQHKRHVLLLDSESFWSDARVSMVDGVLLQNPHQSTIDNIPPGLPCVAMLNGENLTSVVANDYGGAKSAVRHLIDLGHRRIALLSNRQPPVTPLRFAGYVDALREAGIEFDPRWEWQPNASCIGRDYLNWGHDNMRRWLQNGWCELGCTALVTQNDHVAAGVMQALREAEIRVPEQLSVIGFDGTELCDCLHPRLTSVVVPLHEIARRAVELLVQKIEGRNDENAAPETLMLPTSIKPGESTAPPGAG